MRDIFSSGVVILNFYDLKKVLDSCDDRNLEAIANLFLLWNMAFYFTVGYSCGVYHTDHLLNDHLFQKL